MIKKILLCLALLMSQNILFAQDVATAEGMRSNGKIYVVVAVILTIFAGIIIYLFRLDRKISRLEKEDKNQFITK